jgi:hypothetical protein
LGDPVAGSGGYKRGWQVNGMRVSGGVMDGWPGSLWVLRYGWWRRYLRRKYAERFWMGLSDRLPRALRYATWIRVTADATTDPPLDVREVPAIPLGDLLAQVGMQIGPDR